MRSFIIEGVVLKRSNTGEADRIVTIYTKNHGKIKLLAKGVRKITSRRSGNLEIFNLVKAHVVKGRNLDLLTEVETIKTFHLPTWHAYQFIELVDKLTPEGVANYETFTILTRYLSLLSESATNSSSLISRFAVELLQSLGFWPRKREFSGDWKTFVESLIERPLKSPEILTKTLKHIE